MSKKSNLPELVIDPGFESYVPPLTQEEYEQLEKNILCMHRVLEPIIVWEGNIIVDGHNRYRIAKKHPDIIFSTVDLGVDTREEVLDWICRMQLVRRNLTPEQRKYLIGKRYENEKRSHGGDRRSDSFKSSGQNDHLGMTTRARIAQDNNVSESYVKRAKEYARGLEILEYYEPGIRNIDRYIHTDMGSNGIARYLSNQGIHKIERQNGKNPFFDAALISRIIQNPVYCGKIAYGRRRTEKVHGTRNDYHLVEKDDYILVDGCHEGIISEDDWQAAQVKVEAQAKKYEHVKRGKNERIHLLTGIVKCPLCGAGMYGNKSIKHRNGKKYKDYYFYGCKHRLTTRGHKCDYHKQISEEVLDGGGREVLHGAAGLRNLLYAQQTDMARPDEREVPLRDGEMLPGVFQAAQGPFPVGRSEGQEPHHRGHKAACTERRRAVGAVHL